MFRLRIDMIFDLLTLFNPLKLQLTWRQKCKIWLKCHFSHRTINRRKICNASLDALMCPLQIINDIEPLLLSLHGVNPCYIYYPSKVKNYTIKHKSETTQLKENKSASKLHIFTPFCKFLAQNSKYPLLQKFGQFFYIWSIGIFGRGKF